LCAQCNLSDHHFLWSCTTLCRKTHKSTTSYQFSTESRKTPIRLENVRRTHEKHVKRQKRA